MCEGEMGLACLIIAGLIIKYAVLFLGIAGVFFLGYWLGKKKWKKKKSLRVSK